MRNKTRSVARSMIIAILTALAALIIGTMQSLTTAVTASLGLTSVQAIIVPGTGTPNPYAPDRQNYLSNALNYYVVPDGPVGGCALTDASAPCPENTYGVNYYATFWPIPLPGWGGLEGQKWNVSVANGVDNLTTIYTDDLPDDTTNVTIFGYSQGATVANKFKTAHPEQCDPSADGASERLLFHRRSPASVRRTVRTARLPRQRSDPRRSIRPTGIYRYLRRRKSNLCH